MSNLSTTRASAATATRPDISIQNGVISIIGPASLLGAPGDKVEAYMADDIVGCGPIATVVKGAMLAADIAIADLLPGAFPTTIRLLNLRSGQEIDPPITIDSPDALLTMMGDPSAVVSISGIGPNQIDFALVLPKLRGFARKFELRLNGPEVALAESQPASDVKTSGRHTLSFTLSSVIRDGTRIELIDVVTQATIFSIAATWMNLVWPLSSKLDIQEKRLSESEQELTVLRRRLNELMDLGGERLLLERLDMFYFLLNDRFDRELARQPAIAVPALPVVRPGCLRLAPRALEGIGFYDLESNDESEWRWLGPRVTFVLRDLPGTPTHVVLTLFRLHGTPAHEKIDVNVNDVAASVQVKRQEHDIALLEIPVLSNTDRLDGLLIFQLNFHDYFVSEGDGRLLSAAYLEANVFFNSAAPVAKPKASAAKKRK